MIIRAQDHVLRTLPVRKTSSTCARENPCAVEDIIRPRCVRLWAMSSTAHYGMYVCAVEKKLTSSTAHTSTLRGGAVRKTIRGFEGVPR